MLLTELTAHVAEWMVENGRAPASRSCAGHTLDRFVRFAAAFGIHDAADVTPEIARAFIEAPGVNGAAPSVPTMHDRRAAVRLAFRLQYRADPHIFDPTYDLALPSRTTDPARPLTDDEVEILRSVSVSTLIETRQPVIVALAEARAVTTEIATVAAKYIDDGTVWLSGSRALPRTVSLTAWGAQQVARRAVAVPDGPLVCGEHTECGQASVSVALRRMFDLAQLSSERDVRLGSLRAWAGRQAFDESGQIEDAARVLGCRSLDAAARTIGWSWR